MTSIDREKILSLGITKYRQEADKRDRELSKDMEAYKRLRKEGLQPRSVDGSARLEAEAVSPVEIQNGLVPANLDKDERLKMAKRLDCLEFSPARFVR